jgi:hypothetical protein
MSARGSWKMVENLNGNWQYSGFTILAINRGVIISNEESSADIFATPDSFHRIGDHYRWIMIVVNGICVY